MMSLVVIMRSAHLAIGEEGEWPRRGDRKEKKKRLNFGDQAAI